MSGTEEIVNALMMISSHLSDIAAGVNTDQPSITLMSTTPETSELRPIEDSPEVKLGMIDQDLVQIVERYMDLGFSEALLESRIRDLTGLGLRIIYKRTDENQDGRYKDD